ncbi:hypothetical protein EV426DRAFT_575576 [Tirmania nivea]|nr:hypothetical protein EV426DRAFT_575576 [Tirmania nivea]
MALEFLMDDIHLNKFLLLGYGVISKFLIVCHRYSKVVGETYYVIHTGIFYLLGIDWEVVILGLDVVIRVIEAVIGVVALVVIAEVVILVVAKVVVLVVVEVVVLMVAEVVILVVVEVVVSVQQLIQLRYKNLILYMG